MKEYVTSSLETHLFFGRIMKEHALFLQAGFPAGETGYSNKADRYREEFEKILWRTVRLADGMVGKDVLCSGEVFTEFTVMAEQQTTRLTKVPIDFRITQAEERLRADCGKYMDHEMADRMGCQIRRLNQCVLQLLNGLIMFKKQILQEVTCCRLYTANYPLLIEHLLLTGFHPSLVQFSLIKIDHLRHRFRPMVADDGEEIVDSVQTVIVHGIPGRHFRRPSFLSGEDGLFRLFDFCQYRFIVGSNLGILMLDVSIFLGTAFGKKGADDLTEEKTQDDGEYDVDRIP